MLVERLNSVRRLDILQDANLEIRASLKVSYDELYNSKDSLDQQAARAFQLLGLLDTVDLDLSIAARLLNQTESLAEQILERLVDAQLLETPLPARYQLHDLLRLFAQEQVDGQDSEDLAEVALTRVFNCYVATARQASHLLQPTDFRHVGRETEPTGTVPLRERVDALAWLDSERSNLQLIARQAAGMSDQLSALTIDLAIALYWGLRIRSWFHDLEELDRLGIQVARRLGDRDGLARLLDDFGFVGIRLARFDVAAASLEEALAIRRDLGDRYNQAEILRNLAGVHWRQGRLEAARTYLQQARQLYEEVGDRHGEATVLTNSGLVYAALKELEAAKTCQKEALAIFQEVGDSHGEALALTNLSYTLVHLGESQAAISTCELALRISRELRDRDTEAVVLNNLGEAYRHAGELQASVSLQEQAVALSHEIGNPWIEAEALWWLGLAYRDLGQTQRARARWQASLKIFDQLGSPEAAEIRQLLDDYPDEPSGGDELLMP
jgi:tetratricopeptide (TPR) repeat protein